MLAASRTTTSRYDTQTARLLSQERQLWHYRNEVQNLERLAETGADVADLLALMRARVRTLEATQELEWAVERASAGRPELVDAR